MAKIPVIDFSEESSEAGTSSWLSKCNKVREAMEEFGCFVAVYEKVSSENRNQILLSLEELFDLPKETKMKNIDPDMPYFGYLKLEPNAQLAQLFESMGIFNATATDAIQSFANLMWPSGKDNFCETFGSYTKKVSELQRVITRMLFESYGVEEYYDSHINSTAHVLKFIEYEALDGASQENGRNLGVIPHTDTGFITIILQNDIPGLEVKAKDGTWIPLDLPPSSFAVLAGDAVLAWSNGRIHPCIHRVTIDGNETRYSVTLFSYHNGIIEIPQKLADDTHPLKFKPFDHFGYVRFRVETPTMPTEERVKIYAGVSDAL